MVRFLNNVTVIIIVLFTFVTVSVQQAIAATTDEGKIVVTGTVPPKSSSIYTQLSVSPAGSVLNQNQEITYTVAYSSSNVSAIPLTLEVEWDKGKVEGASEASVEALSYVVGSAAKAYSETIPVVDAVNRKITWTIPSLPAGLGTQYLTFKLKTTENYTGSLKVDTGVKLKVLSPIGVADKSVHIAYQYDRDPIVSATTTPLPSSSPTVALDNQNNFFTTSFKQIKLLSVGKTTARILVELDQSATLLFKYGTSISNFTNIVDVNQEGLGHTIYLDKMTPNEVYYFQVAVASDPTVVSDVFTFTTANIDAPESARKPTAISISQQRSLLYTGPTSADNGDSIKPVPVTQSSVLDLNVAVPNGQDIKTVEIMVRSATVLGVSTYTVNSDEFQSLSTVMTKISDSVFVGKLRTPVQPGSYQIISRIEDNFGNLSEEEIGKLKVVRPFTVIDKVTGQPIDSAMVDLNIYNQQERLYEVISNVSTSIINPTYTNKMGIAEFALTPARYLAQVSAPGYLTQTIEFEVGSQDLTDFPIVSLVETANPVLRNLQYTNHLFVREWGRWMEQFRNLAQTRVMYEKVFILQILLTVISVSVVVIKKLKFSPVQNAKLPHGIRDFIGAMLFFTGHIIRFFVEFFLMVCFVFGMFFLSEYAGFKGGMFMLGACVNLAIWMWYLWLQKKSV